MELWPGSIKSFFLFHNLFSDKLFIKEEKIIDLIFGFTNQTF